MNKKTDNLKIDINTINPYTNNLLWSLLYFKDLKKQGYTKILWSSNKKRAIFPVAFVKKRKLQPIIDNLKRRMEKLYGKK